MNCLGCKFSHGPFGEMLVCKRYPPVLDDVYMKRANATSDEDVESWVQPLVDFDDWCGEFKGKHEHL